jgi:hypothetical protein
MWSLSPSAPVLGCLALVGCAPEPPRSLRRPPVLHPVSSTPSPTTTTPTGCAPDPGLALLVEPSEGALPNQLDLRLSASTAFAPVVRCVAADDPSEVHLLEAPGAAPAHDLSLGGLLPSTAYTCDVASSCPVGAAPVRFGWTTGPAPTTVDLGLRIDAPLGVTAGYTLAFWEPGSCSPDPAPSILAWDARGALRWWWSLPPDTAIGTEVNVHPWEPWIQWGGGELADGYPRAVDPVTGVEVASTALPERPRTRFSHDFRTLPDGRQIVLEEVPNALGGHAWFGFEVRRWDPATGAVESLLTSQALVEGGTLRPPGSPLRFDPWHANALAWDEGPDGPSLTVSLFAARQILALEPTTGELSWRLGPGFGWSVLDEDGAPLGDEVLPQGTHGIERSGDRLLVYDNGVDRGQSEVAEWRVDPATSTAQRTWRWTEPGFYERILGDVDELPRGRVLVTMGRRGCGAAAESVEVVRATGEVAARRTFPAGSVYRSEQVDGCRLFASARECPALAERLGELAPLFE